MRKGECFYDVRIGQRRGSFRTYTLQRRQVPEVSESVIELHLARKLPLKMEKFVSTDGCGGAENGFRNAAAPQTEMKGKSHYGVRYGYKMTILP